MYLQVVSVAVFVSSCGLSALANAQGSASVGQLPPHPYQKLNHTGYARFVFGANAPGNLVVELRSVFIKAGGQTQLTSLPGPGLLEVKNGAGTISLGKHGKPTALDPANLTKLDMHETATLNNTGGQPLVIQLYLFEAK